MDDFSKSIQNIQDELITPQQPQQSNLQGKYQLPPEQSAFQSQTADQKPDTPKKKPWLKRLLLIVVGIVVIVSVLLGYLMFRGFKEAPAIQDNVTSFMQNVSSGSYQNAYALTSEEFKETTSMEEFIQAMSLFEAQYTQFQFQEQVGFKVEANVGEQTVYQYSGVVTYTNGDTGDLNAVLVKEGDDYKILSIEVNVGLDRAKQFSSNDQDSDSVFDPEQ